MEQLLLFCDGSVNPQRKIGFGAYFIFDAKLTNQNIKIQRFEKTSSTKLELEILICAFDNFKYTNEEIIIYTDCQNILSLIERREKLESNNYKTSTGKIVKNHELYKKFYKKIDRINKNSKCIFKKVKGHKKSSQKDDIDKLFNLVDKASRKALREYLVDNLKD